MAAAQTWVRKALDVSQLPRVRLNNIQDLPGAKRKVCVYAYLYRGFQVHSLEIKIFACCSLIRVSLQFT